MLVQDALPASELWLAALTAPLFADEQIAGTFARQLPRPDASAVTRYYLSRYLVASDVARRSQSQTAPNSTRSIRWRNSSAACSTTSVPASAGRSGSRIGSVHADRRGHRVGEGGAARGLQAGLRSGRRCRPFPRSVGALRTAPHVHAPSPAVRTVPVAHDSDTSRLVRAIASSLALHSGASARTWTRACGPSPWRSRGRSASIWALCRRPRLEADAIRWCDADPGGRPRIPTGRPGRHGSVRAAHAHALRDAGDDVVVLAREADANRADYDVRREKRDGLICSG